MLKNSDGSSLRMDATGIITLNAPKHSGTLSRLVYSGASEMSQTVNIILSKKITRSECHKQLPILSHGLTFHSKGNRCKGIEYMVFVLFFD